MKVITFLNFKTINCFASRYIFDETIFPTKESIFKIKYFHVAGFFSFY